MATIWTIDNSKSKKKKVEDPIPVNTAGTTKGQYSAYQYGTMPQFSTKYDTKADNMLGKIEKYGDYKSQYQPQIDQFLGRITDTTPYTSKYQDKIDKYLELMDSEYDPNNDASYLAYKNQYLRGGQKAMQDTLAQAAALTGGFGSSYGQSVAQQTYNDYTAALADKIPELAQAAQDMYMSKLGVYRDLDNTDYSRWSDDRQNNFNVMSTLMGLDDTAYGRWNDKRNNMYNLLDAYGNLGDRDYGRFSDEYSRWATAYGQQKELEEAALASASGGGGGGGGGDYGSDYDTDILTELNWAGQHGRTPTAGQTYLRDRLNEGEKVVYPGTNFTLPFGAAIVDNALGVLSGNGPTGGNIFGIYNRNTEEQKKKK